MAVLCIHMQFVVEESMNICTQKSMYNIMTSNYGQNMLQPREVCTWTMLIDTVFVVGRPSSACNKDIHKINHNGASVKTTNKLTFSLVHCRDLGKEFLCWDKYSSITLILVLV